MFEDCVTSTVKQIYGKKSGSYICFRRFTVKITVWEKNTVFYLQWNTVILTVYGKKAVYKNYFDNFMGTVIL